jgi:aspartate/tyrosine/aromatic aminotransferase
MTYPFGASVQRRAEELAAQGKDANQIAKIVCDQDPEGCNYGIGILLDGQGLAWPTSPTLLDYARKELDGSGLGTYMNSAGLMSALKEAVLRWQRIPETYWDRFHLLIPSDAGTGAVQTSVEMALALDPALQSLGVEELSWPAYRAIARVARIRFREYPIGAVIDAEGVLPVYQAGPMNTTGRVQRAETMTARAAAAAAAGRPVLLDRAYAGFEYARLVHTHPYARLMAMSFEAQIRPFIEEGVSFWVSISPTKAFVTFSLRPCGLVLYHTPDASRHAEATALVNAVMRARGSSFEHPLTRAFVRALTGNLDRLEQEHRAVLERLSAAEALWRRLSDGTALARQFSDDYAGLFRNVQVRPEARAALYNEHLYPVFAEGRCRLNITGIPADEGTARRHVTAFAEQCV